MTPRIAAAALALALAPVAALATPGSITLTTQQITDGTIKVAPPAPITYTPSRRGYGMVVDGGAILALHAKILAAQAQSRLAALTAKRTSTLFHGAGNVSEASVQQAAAAQAVAGARLAGLIASARATYGSALATAAIHGGAALKSLATGALIEVSLPTGRLHHPPSIAHAGATTLHLIGPAGHLAAGTFGETLYYTGPTLPVGTPLAVTIPTGGQRGGVVIPLSAIIYGRHHATLYVETTQGHFSILTLPTTQAIHHHGTLTGYFLPTGTLPANARLVVRGAGLLRSIDKSRAKSSGALPVGD